MVMQTDNQCSELVLRTLIFLWEDEADIHMEKLHMNLNF